MLNAWLDIGGFLCYNEHMSITKEINIMKIAVTFENGNVFQHFGHTEYFKIYTVTDGAVTSSEIRSTNGSGHSALAKYLSDYGVETLICGGIGGCAITALSEAGIKVCGGVSGSADDAVAALLAKTLVYASTANCNHHDHDHSCGEHEEHEEHEERGFLGRKPGKEL